ncbi:MAG: zinc ribbon domain-containing protein [Planctomycetes bacterium]|nr:zinc ribbon domain-containing protein [Planctomycetota bacterium]
MEEFCPHCGEPIARDAKSCRHCGSDHETGWASDLEYYELEIPEPLAPEEHAANAGEGAGGGGRRLPLALAFIGLLIAALLLCGLTAHPLHWRIVTGVVFAVWLFSHLFGRATGESR